MKYYVPDLIGKEVNEVCRDMKVVQSCWNTEVDGQDWIGKQGSDNRTLL